MTEIGVVTDSPLPAERVLAAARDFSLRRAEVFPAVRIEHLEVHDLGDDWADVTEGTPAGIGINWERCHYDWSQPGSVKATVTSSNVYAPSGSSWELCATPSDAGSRVEMIWRRESTSSSRGRVFGTLFRLIGKSIFRRYARDIAVVIHTAAQPSHDWAVRDPYTDFEVNAVGTLNVLQHVREYCVEAPVIHCSTNKVYGDRPNSLPLVELDTRWEIEPGHPYEGGIREDMSIDDCLHSVFGASKVAADVMVQEYGRYFDMRTACFRGGTLTGPAHAATELHGFLAYVMRCAMERRPYTIYGYKGKQVRDAIHSHDVVAAFEAFFRSPRSAEIYNLGGGRHSNASVLEAIALAEKISGNELSHTYVDTNRIGDHIWWIGSNASFAEHYPTWRMTYDVPAILGEIYEANVGKWVPGAHR